MTPALPEPLKRALVAYQTGDLAGAADLCRDVLAKHDRSDALYFAALHLLATVQFRSGRLTEALASYDEALAVRPQSLDTLRNRANVLGALKRFDEAVADYDRALALRPDFAEAHIDRANVLMQMKRFEEALASYDKALAIRPDDAIGLSNRGSALHALRRSDEAVMSYDKALAINPDFVEALINRGTALAAQQRFEEALASCQQSLALRPRSAWALTTRGKILYHLGRFEDAVASYDKALAVQPEHVEALHHRARALTELGRFEEALASCGAVLAGRPDSAEAFNQRGLILIELRRLPEALASFRKAQQLQPELVDAHRNELQLYLLVGDYRGAWWKYDERLKQDASALPPSKFPSPPWDGLKMLFDKTILLYGDRAYDDTIQFCRYIPILAAQGARVILDVERPLRELVAGIDGVTQVVTDEHDPVAFDFHCPFAGLPRARGTTLASIPAKVPYLRPPLQAAAKWDVRLDAKQRRRIGIVWSGDPPHERDPRYSIELAALLPLLDVDATFVCVQRDIASADEAVLKKRPNVLTFGDALRDFSEAAALVSRLDLVISVDSCIAHLAGALGRPAWVLLSYTPNWRWLLDREDSPWYPTARLFRQRRPEGWNDVVARVAVELQKFVTSSSATVHPGLDPVLLSQVPAEPG